MFFSCLQVATALPNSPQGIFDLLTEDEVPELVLAINYDELESVRMNEDFIDATLTEGTTTHNLEVRVRGRFRRTTCAMPPLKLKFDKQWLRAAGLNRHNDFKLVTHCTQDQAGQEALLREQLAYELYATIAGEAALRTELVKVTYVNTVDGSTESSYAILIEDIDDLEDRLAAHKLDNIYGTSYDRFTNAEVVSLFQYMIGNTDYSLAMGRNVKLVEGENEEVTAVPYDFDFSGLVSASYMRLRTDLGQDSPHDRIWIWELNEEPQLEAATQHFLDLEEQLLDQVDNYNELSNGSRREIKNFLKGFFRDLDHNRVTK